VWAVSQSKDGIQYRSDGNTASSEIATTLIIVQFLNSIR
jgi:hypothetical protein